MNEVNKSFTNVFNSNSIWKEIDSILNRIVKYLDKNKLASSIKETLGNDPDLVNNNKVSKNYSVIEKFQEIYSHITNTLKDNKLEETNSFFVEYFRLSALFFYSTGETSKAIDLLNEYISNINNHLQGVEEEFHDKNLLIERDRMLINKAEILFWENRYYECNEIINNRISYLKEGLADEYYLIKMTYFYSTILTYKAWIFLIDDDDIEADKSFYLSIKLLKDFKKILESSFSKPDYTELHKRQVNIYDQYVNFLLFKENKNKESVKELKNLNHKNSTSFLLWENFEPSNEIKLYIFKFVKEILKILFKERENSTKYFDENIQESLVIYYSMMAAYFCASVTQNEEINIENCLYHLTHAFITNNQLHLSISGKLYSGILTCIISMINIEKTYGKSININRTNSNDKNLIIKTIQKLKQMLNQYENDNSNLISKEAYNQTPFNKILDIDYQKNHAEANLIKFSAENKKNPINEMINEIFVINHVFQKFNYVLACNVLQDKKLSLTSNTIVIEGLNGFLIVEDTSLTLIVQNTLLKETDKVFGVNNKNVEISGEPSNYLLGILSLKSHEYYYLYYSKFHFSFEKDSRMDIFGYLVLLNYYDSMGLYKCAILTISNLLNEMVKNTSIIDLKISFSSHFELYLFLNFLLIKYYFKMDDFEIAYNCLRRISYEISDYSFVIYYILMAVCLSKKKYFDLSAVYFEKTLNVFSEVINFVNENEQKNEMMSNVNSIKEEIVNENFIIPVKILISIANMMKLKVISDFTKLIDLEKEKDNDSIIEKTIKEPTYFEAPILFKNCYNCNKSSLKNDEKKVYNCVKCKRALYCSYECMKADKGVHKVICNMYFNNIEKVNNLIKSYILNDD